MIQEPPDGKDRVGPNGDASRSIAAPIGGIVALVCFFMPWVGCMGQNISAADAGGILWLVFIAGIGVVASYFHFRSQRRLHEAKAPIIGCAATGVLVMLAKYAQFLTTEGHEMFSLRFGSVATLVGLIGSIYGATQLPTDDPG